MSSLWVNMLFFVAINALKF